MTVDAAVEQFLTEHLLEEKGREPKTVNDYRLLHAKWFSPEIGGKLLRTIDEATVDRLFGRMTRAGLSHSRMNQAKSLYRPFFRWAKSRRLIDRNPMADFQLPTARKRSHERIPPEVEELVLLLRTAAEVVPDIAPVLALGAVTGMHRGELLGLRRSRLHSDTGRIVVDAAIDEGRRVKTTKTRRDRTFHVDAETMAVLQSHCRELIHPPGVDDGEGVVVDRVGGQPEQVDHGGEPRTAATRCREPEQRGRCAGLSGCKSGGSMSDGERCDDGGDRAHALASPNADERDPPDRCWV